jgi:hypothetical protein
VTTGPASAVPASAPARLDRDRWRAAGAVADRLNRIDANLAVRLRGDARHIRLLAWLPTKALVGVTVRSDRPAAGAVDMVTGAGWLAAWLAGELPAGAAPPRRDAEWLTPVPPQDGWRRLEILPGAVVRDLVRQGAAAHADAARLDLGARAADSLLDTPVVKVAAADSHAEITNRSLSALVAMGFLPGAGDRDSQGSDDRDEVAVAVRGRWTRVSTVRGSVFAANRSDGLGLA